MTFLQSANIFPKRPRAYCSRLLEQAAMGVPKYPSKQPEHQSNKLPKGWPVVIAWMLLLLVLAAPRTAVAQKASSTTPTDAYFQLQVLMVDGEFVDARKEYVRESRNSVKTPTSRWIDSICYHAMIGECYYHMGENALAIEQYNAALNLFVANSNWMQSVKFPPQIQPDVTTMRKGGAPWGRPTRRSTLGKFPHTMHSGQGTIDAGPALQQGGIVMQPVFFPINVQEIVRCTTLCMRRRLELMGPVCKYDPLTSKVLSRLKQRPGLPNHWSEAWIDVQLGIAYACSDDTANAQKYLVRSLIVAGEMDHPLTPVALLELGKLSLASGNFDAASRWFEEASYSAFFFNNYMLVAEAFQYGQRTHLMAGKEGLYPPLGTALQWATAKRYRYLQAVLGSLIAENYAFFSQPQPALQVLSDTAGVVARRDMSGGAIGARINYIAALVNYQLNRPQPAEQYLAAALQYQQRSSHWVYQITLADNLYVSRTLNARTSMTLYTQLLPDPSAADWKSDPLEALSALMIPHSAAFEHWFFTALERKEPEQALGIADLARRHRFFTSLPLGGRLLTLRTILETPPTRLTQTPLLQRQALLMKYPRYKQLSQQAAAIRLKLRKLKLVPENDEQHRQMGAMLEELAKLSAEQEVILREMALRRDPANMDFPPRRNIKHVQEFLPKKVAVLTFFNTTQGMHAFLFNNERLAHWQIGSGAAIREELVKLLRVLGNFDQNREITQDELQKNEWQPLVRNFYKSLVAGSKIDLGLGLEELVIVPDGPLWYMPFELLPITDSKGNEDILLSNVRIRYVPTMGLARPDRYNRPTAKDTAVVVGKLFPRDKEEVAAGAFEQLRSSVPNAVELKSPLPAHSNIYGSLIDQLVVYDDLKVTPAMPYLWQPIPLDRGRSLGVLGHYFTLPWGAPGQMILPGFHTAAEDSLKRAEGGAAGNEIFLTLCAMMAEQSNTILLSRWRTGGQTAFDLVREFTQELPHLEANDAWQRSVMIAREQPLNWDVEPRLKRFDTDQPPTAKHPFFWAGYMLVDTGAKPMKDDPEAESKKRKIIRLTRPTPQKRKIIKFPDRIELN